MDATPEEAPAKASTEDLIFKVEDGIARVTINRPQARNAFTFEMYDALRDACEAVNADRSVKVMVLNGAGGKAFSSGTDIALFRDFSSPDDIVSYEAFMDRVLDAVETCRVPTIAAISGFCTGGGGAIAACCDLRLATSDAKFGFPIARTLGNALSVTNLGRLASLIGPARVKEMIFTARLIEAEEGRRIGLFTEMLADQDALTSRVTELAGLIAQHAPLTMQATKEGLLRFRDEGREAESGDLIQMCYGSDDFKEGMTAFLEKRVPQWQGR